MADHKGITGYKGKVAIFTSFYSYFAFAPYTISLARTLGLLSKLGIEWDYLARPADFHIERAINNTLSEVMERDDFTDVLLIDSDESWKAEDVVRLLLYPQEIVGATYIMKNTEENYVGSLVHRDGIPVGLMQSDGTALLQANRVAAGFMRIKVSALKKWAAAYPDLISTEPDGVKHQFFSRMIDVDEGSGNRMTFCQDMAFSKRWLDIGGEMWIDPNIHIGHWWITNHQGDFDKHLRSRKAEQDAFAIVEQMAKDRA